MNATFFTTVRAALSVLGLFVSLVALALALVSIQGMSGSEPFREPLSFFTVSFAVAFGLGAACSLPLTGRYRTWPTLVAFASGGALGGVVLAGALQLITVFETGLRASTGGGPLGVFVMAAVVGALLTPVPVGRSLLRRLRARTVSSRSPPDV